MVGSFNDEVDLTLATVRPQVLHPRLSRLCLHAHAERYQRLEEFPE